MTDARDDSPADTATDGLLPAGFSHRRQRIEALGFPDFHLAGHNRGAGATPLDPRAVALYCRKNGAPESVHGICADYRAGATVDYADDKADEAEGRTIAAPTLMLWGSKGFAVANGDPLAIWRRWARSVTGRAVDSGHFIPEEDPAAVVTAFLEFFSDTGAVPQ